MTSNGGGTTLGAVPGSRLGLGVAGTKVAVTGPGGFIGSHVVHALVEAGADVTVLAGHLGWRPTMLDLARSGRVRHAPVDPMAADLPPTQLTRALDEAELVVHLAYKAPTAGSPVARWETEAQANLLGTLRLLHALPRSVRRFCYASSTAVYGNDPPVPVTEMDCPRPQSAYAVVKLAAEGLLKTDAAPPVNVTILRLATVYGPTETVPRAIPSFIQAALRRRPPRIRGTGEDVRDFVHVRDVARAVLLGLTDPTAGVSTYNVGGGQGRTLASVAELVRDLVGNAPPAVREPGPAPWSLVCDISAIRRTGWEPTVPFESAVAEEVDWLRDNPERWTS